MAKKKIAPALTPEEIEEARALRDSGMSIRAVAAQMHRSTAAIYKWTTQPVDKELPAAVETEEQRKARRRQCIDKAYRVVDKLLDRVEQQVDKNEFGPKHPAAVVLGIAVDKLVALEMADQKTPNLPGGNSINIFAEINQLGAVFEKVANADGIHSAGQRAAVDGDLCTDDPEEPVHPALPQAAPEAGGVLAGNEPEDGAAVH